MQVDEDVGPGQARKADRHAIQRGDDSLQSIAPLRDRHLAGRRVRGRQKQKMTDEVEEWGEVEKDKGDEEDDEEEGEQLMLIASCRQCPPITR